MTLFAIFTNGTRRFFTAVSGRRAEQATEPAPARELRGGAAHREAEARRTQASSFHIGLNA